MPLLRRGCIEDNTIVPFASLAANGSVPNPNPEGSFNAPNVRDLLNAELREIRESVVAPSHYLSRMLTTSTGVPSEIVDVLRNSCTTAIADMSFRADYQGLLGQPISVTETGAELQVQTALMEAKFKSQLSTVATLREHLFDKYVR